MKKYLTIVSAGLMLIIIFLLYFFQESITEETFTQADSLQYSDTLVISEEEPKIYGISLDSMQIHEGTIARNQFLADILSDFNIPYTTLDKLTREYRDVFDVRKLAINKKYAILFDEDSIKKGRYFVYEPNDIEYVVFDFKDSLHVKKFHRAVDTVTNKMAGIIDYSLYKTMTDQNVSPVLVNKLADVYAWQIDFFRIQRGDRFKVIYEEYKVKDKTVGIGRVIAAYFEHFDSPYYAFHYDQGSGIDYFDEEGNSLRKAFLKAPLSFSRISSRFSHSRLHPVLKIRRPHHGIDYAAPTGTPVKSIGDGTVIKRGYHGGAGNMVKIRHNSVYTTAYLHLNNFAKGISVGSRVKQGEVIGYVGSTGLSTGPHLDFRIWKNGSPVNPLSVKPPPSEPIHEEHRSAYEAVQDVLKPQLDTLSYPNVDNIFYAETK